MDPINPKSQPVGQTTNSLPFFLESGGINSVFKKEKPGKVVFPQINEDV